MDNPFHPRLPLTEPTWFYGRRRELQKVLGYLHGPHPRHVALVGQRSIGKTWLLQYIHRDTDVRRENLDEPQSYVFVYLDLRTDRPEPMTETVTTWFFSSLLEGLLASLPRATAEETWALASSEGTLYRRLREMIRRLRPQWRVVFLLDAFDDLVGDPGIEDGLFRQLRALPS